ncbi:MAG TPA: CBS domain-containing protein [Turneriella sp.]|nr:CBS domain-containing protein [Turneriella sp.]HNJ66549.1 CBS domain-containing protein [Turneriella sp.]HNL10722.1 CBS domain-containing protein [Turneriella sp.]HNN00459.1 CBS domain-containing protein [Turneriella sp.]
MSDMLETTSDRNLNSLHQRLLRIRNTRVGDVMKRDVITLDATDLLATAARTLIENKIHGLVVMKDGKPWSVLSAFDLLHKSYVESFSDKMDYLRSTLDSLIDQPILHSLKPNDSLDSAARLFTVYGQRTIPVIEGDKLMGIITITDLIRAYGRLVGESGI